MSKARWPRVLTRLALAIAVLCAVATVLTLHAIAEGQRELRASGTLLASGDLEQAVVRARRSASWYVPGSSHVPAAYERMIDIARVAEGRSDIRLALFAWQAVRSAALSTRWITVPQEAQLTAANAAIARLSTKLPRPQGASDRNTAEVEREALARLRRQEHPFVPWVLVMIAGFSLTMIGLSYFALRAITTQGTIDWKRVRPSLLIAAAGAIAWMLALWRA